MAELPSRLWANRPMGTSSGTDTPSGTSLTSLPSTRPSRSRSGSAARCRRGSADEVGHDGRHALAGDGAVAVGADEGGAGVGAHLLLPHSPARGIAELQNQLVGGRGPISSSTWWTVPQVRPHGQALVQGLLPHLLAGIVVILRVPDAVAEILQAVPGEPPLEHLRVTPGISVRL